MDSKNIELEQSSILTNHECRHIVFQAPTVSELEEKVRDYELALIRVVTSRYRLIDLSLENNSCYLISPTGCYQSVLWVNFNGKRKERITKPEETKHYLEKLANISAKQPQKISLMKGVVMQKENLQQTEKLIIEVEQEYKIDEMISRKQREILEQLISKTNLTNISFIMNSKHKDPNTGKFLIIMSVTYISRETPTPNVNHTTPEDPGNR